MPLATVHTITGAAPSAAGVAAVGSVIRGLSKYDWFTIDASLVGGTGGTLDVYLQRKIEGVDQWRDWVRFPQLAAGAAAIHYSCHAGAQPGINAVGIGTGATPLAPSLGSSTGINLGGHPGDQVRMVCSAGASTSAGGTQIVYITGWQSVK